MPMEPSIRERGPGLQPVPETASLTWRIGEEGHGRVRALGPRALLLEGKLPKPLPSREVELKAQFNRKNEYLIKGVLEDDPDLGVFFRVEEAGSLRVLQDLLGPVRKVQHIDLCEKEDVEASDRFNGFAKVRFVPEALPDLDFEVIDTSSYFLGRKFASPFFITGMTGGVELGALINRRLAEVAQEMNIPMGVGSQRIACENPQHADIFTVKRDSPGVFLIGNLGFAQIVRKDGLQLCRQAVEMIEADALAIHLNALQECIQTEGDSRFRGGLDRLAEICAKLPVPVIVKEVGCGISPQTAGKLLQAGVAAIDVAGRGGTSWGYIEGLRSGSEQTLAVAQAFRDWGIPTAYALSAIRARFPEVPLIATGGVRDGLMAAKACALGANLVGLGLPLMRAALQSSEAVHEILRAYLRGLKIAMLTTGSRTLPDLRRSLVWGEPLEDELRRQLGGISDAP